MAYLALARRWRPRTFAEVVGQDHVVQALSGALRDDRVHHALLFSGTRGVGKTTIARALAKSLNCEQGPTPSPCGECSSCLEIAEGRHVDLIEIDAASRTKVEDTRELLENVQYRPTRGRYKIYLIDEVHMLSRHSFNALLKTLEEPPGHVKFLLATTDPQKLPVTVLSRCLQFHLRSLSALEISGHLAHVLTGEGIVHEAAALDELAAAAKGSLRDALSLTDQAVAFGQGEVRAVQVSAMLGTARREGVAQLVRLLAAGDAEGLLAQVEQLAAQAVGFERLLTQLAEAMHRIAMIQFLGATPGLLAEQPWPQLAEQLAPEVVQLYYRFFLEGRRELPLAPDPRLALEMTLLRALAFRPLDNAQPPQASPQTRPSLLAAHTAPQIANVASSQQAPNTPNMLSAQLADIEAQAAALRGDPAAPVQAAPVNTAPTPPPAAPINQAQVQAAPVNAPLNPAPVQATPANAVNSGTAQVLSALQLLRGGDGEPPNQPERSPLPAVASNRPAAAPVVSSPTAPTPAVNPAPVASPASVQFADRPPWEAPAEAVLPTTPQAVESEPQQPDQAQADEARFDEVPPIDEAHLVDDAPPIGEPYFSSASQSQQSDQPPQWDEIPAPDLPLTPAPAAVTPVSTAPVSAVPAPLAQPVQPVAPSASAQALAEQWQQLALQLGLKGLVLQLALNSELYADGPGWLLRVVPEQAHLIDNARMQTLGQAISQALGGSAQLRYEVGPSLVATPAQARNARLAARRELALAAMAADPFVQQLQQQCAATLASDSLELFDETPPVAANATL